MTFDPDLSVNPTEIIEALRGNRRLTADQWEDAKEYAADMIKQFVAMREQTNG